ncbi:holo-ACP synthase [Vagococcus fessus]|uniref:Holo-[acyl-carrier-protein] synthase n=1 Tax=Vagococcus fessus TaxID=120370 RepID=A0A430A4J3_9ENTE|nr:holo-ACP synthase [Vagococcus fessus]RSU01656.1 holo-ACP synthase [Vagococcus fessus]
MIRGIGLDVVEIDRMKTIVSDKPLFISRVLTENEVKVFESLGDKRKVEFLAGRFACKEAFSKAYGTGIGEVGFQDIEVLSLESGQPVVTKSPFEGKCWVSISHTADVAIAQIILEG